jgi:hypothetical protein
MLLSGREYEIPADPIKVLGLLDHLSGKAWDQRLAPEAGPIAPTPAA